MRARALLAVTAAIAVSLTPSVATAAPHSAAPLIGGAGTGNYLVVLKAGSAPSTVDAVARRAGTTIERRYSAVVTGFSARLGPDAIAALRHDPAVAYLAADRVVRAEPTPAGYVTGVAALYLEFHPTATAQQVHDAVVSNATPNVVLNPGTGSPNLLLYSLVT